MFKAKADIDRHVRTSFAKLSETEKSNRSLTIAKLYYKIGEYASARQYIYNYLTVGNDRAEAHKLLGQCYEKLKTFDKAVTSYQQSLRLDPKQPEVLANVCNLILTNEINIDQVKIKDIIDLAETENIQNDAVLNLKFKLNKDKIEPAQLNEMVMKEILARPTVPSLRIRLLKNFVEQSRITEAFKYAYDTETKNNEHFATSLNWYNMVAKVLEYYRSSPEKLCPKNWEFWLLTVTTVEKQIYLNLVTESRVQFSQDSNLKEITELLFEFDQLLKLASSMVLNLCPERELAVQFLSHYRGQWCLHAASILLLREKSSNKNQWKETLKYTMPLLLLSFQCGIPDTRESWLKHASDNTRQLILLWNRQGAFRCSQAGRTILSCIADADLLDIVCSEKSFIFTSAEDLIDETRKFCSDSSWRLIIYRNIFVNNNITRVEMSNFVNSKSLSEPAYEVPIATALEKYEEIAQWLYPFSLSFMVYLGLGMKNLDILTCAPFNQLNFSVPNIANCGTATLNQLDIETYLAAAVIQAKRNLELEKKNYEIYNSCSFPIILPYGNIAGKLCTEEQSDWWTVAYKISRNVVVEDFVKYRMILQHGIQAIRGIGTPTISLYIVLSLAHILEKRSKYYKLHHKGLQKDFTETRALALYRHGLQIIKINQRGNVADNFNSYFKYSDPHNEIAVELNSMAEKGIAFIAKKHFEKAEYEDCAEELAEIQLPYAAYYQAAAYNSIVKTNKGVLSKKIYAEKAKDSLNRALEFLSLPNVENNHPLRTIVTSESVSNGFFYDNDVKEDNASNDEKFNEILVKMSDMEKLIRQVSTSLGVVCDEVIEMKKSDLYNIKCELLEVQSKLNDLLNKKSTSLRDEDAQVLANLLDDEFQNQVLAGQMGASYNNQAQAQGQFPLQNPNAMQYYLQQQTAAASNPYANIYNNSGYPVYMYPFMNYPQQTTGIPPKQQAQVIELPKTIADLSPQLTDAHTLLGNITGLPLNKNPYEQQQDSRLPQSSISEMISTSSFYKSMYPYNNAPVEKSAPINVVITNSDPLPTHSQITTQPPLSVTIPPQHIKNNSNITAAYNPTDVAGVASSTFEQKQPVQPAPAVQQPPPPTQVAPTAVQPTFDNEDEIFSAPMQFFKAFNGDWKEAASGKIKLLTHKASKTSRIAVIQESNGSVPFSYAITETTKCFMNKPNLRVANWSSLVTKKDGTTVTVKYCAKFTDSDTARKFCEAGEKLKPPSLTEPLPKPPAEALEPIIPATVGGFQITNPVVKEVKQQVPQEAAVTPPKSNLFANFSFSKSSENTPSTLNSFANIFSTPPTSTASSIFAQSSNTPFATPTPQASQISQPNLNRSGAGEDGEDDYVPTAQFKPVITLPEIEVKTGEEDEIIAFEERAKLLRFDSSTKEWKDRGVGPMKILIHKTDADKIRLLMRREQVFKLCCNQLLAKTTEFKYLPKSETAISWCGPDYSDNELRTEVLALRFKKVDSCKEFLRVIKDCQEKMNDEKKQPVAAAPNSAPEKTSDKGFGDLFKPKPGAWNCDGCYTVNTGNTLYCVACEAPKDNNVPKKEAKALVLPPASASKYTFGFAPAAVVQPASTTFAPTEATKDTNPPSAAKGFGDQFKPKAGAWNCDTCYVSNKPDTLYCASCETPKDNTVPKKEPKSLLTMPTASKFTFGVPAAAAPPTTTGSAAAQTLLFGSSAATTTAAQSTFSFGSGLNTSTTNTSTSVSTSTTHMNFFGKQQTSSNSVTEGSGGFSLNNSSLTPQKESTFTTNSSSESPMSAKSSAFKLEPKASFDFVLKPKSPSKLKSPFKDEGVNANADADDDENGVAEEEENNAYFTPVIPLPDKIEVKTGEEDEETLYSHRAKLYRFVDSEWKERGLGDVKILRHNETKKLRVVMRREQVLKLCLNHFLTPEVTYKKKDGKSFHFVANDYSDGKLELMNLCLRFKTVEIADGYKEAIDNALSGASANGSSFELTRDKSMVNVADKVNSKENSISSEEQQLIDKLMLPRDFYKFKTTNDCKGCRGCKSEDFVFPKVADDFNRDIINQCQALPFEFKALDLSTLPQKSKTTTESLNNLGSNEKEKPVSAASIFDGKVNIFGGSATSFNSPKANPVTPISSTASLFGPTSFMATPTKDTSTKENENVSEEDNEKAEKTIFGGGMKFGTPPKFGELKPGFGTSNFSFQRASATIPETIFGSKSTSSSFSFIDAAKDIENKTASNNDVKIEPPKLSFPTDTSATDSKPLFGYASSVTKDQLSSTQFITEEKKPEVAGSVFGSSTPLFGGGSSQPSYADVINTTTPSLFKTSENVSFSSLAAASNTKSTADSSVDLSKDILKTDPSLSFASLASGSAPSTAFQNKNIPAQGYFGLSNNQDFSHFFKNAAQANLDGSAASRDDSGAHDTSATEENTHDPHFEPIIALPDEIVVTTGEENEVKLFGERSKLFRYDTSLKEWKERGVGELKILHHPTNGTYRLLMRREQIHKLVLNHAITADFVYNPMNTSGNAYCWATINYPEEHSQGETEKLAARFKNTDITQRFDNEIKKALEQLKSRSGELEPEDD